MNKFILDDDRYNLILEWSYGFAIDSLWLSVCKLYSDASHEDCKEIFLQVLYKILLERKARLACGELLEGSISSQIETFKNSWPAQEDIDENLFWATKSGVSWVPGGLVWLYDDGVEVWT